MQTAGEKTFSFLSYRLDLRRGSLRAGDREIALRPKSFEVLRYLVENAGRLVAKDELIRRVWPNVTVADEALARWSATCVRRSTIATRASSRPCRGVAITSLRPSRSMALAPKRGTHREPYRNALAPPFSMVVLPFTSLSGDPAQNYLADIITEGLTSYLSHIRNAFVIARSTALTYKGKAVDARQVGRELGVRYVLEGSEQHGSGRVRESIQLIDVETGAHLWADRFDADQADMLQMQDDIVTRLPLPGAPCRDRPISGRTQAGLDPPGRRARGLDPPVKLASKLHE